MGHVRYKVLFAYDGVEILVYPSGEFAFWTFFFFVAIAFLANFVMWLYSAESFFGSIGWILGFALFTTLFTGLSAVGCRRAGCMLAEIMCMAQPWGWLFGACAIVGTIIVGVDRLIRPY